MRRKRRAENLRRLRRAARSTDIAIDELVLHGFPTGDRHAIGDAFALELERAFSASPAQPLFRQEADLPSLDAGRFSMTSHARPASVGTQAARAVVGVLRSAGRGTSE
jgi:hypothetical protein